MVTNTQNISRELHQLVGVVTALNENLVQIGHSFQEFVKHTRARDEQYAVALTQVAGLPYDPAIDDEYPNTEDDREA